MMKQIQIICFIALLLCLAAPVFAAAPPPPPTSKTTATRTQPQPSMPLRGVDPEALKAAQELFNLMDMDAMTRQIMSSMSNTMMPLLTRDNPEKQALIKELMDKVYIPTFMFHLDEMRQQVTMLYAQEFSSIELGQMIQFYKSPVGHKFLQKMPLITEQSMKIGMAWATRSSQEASRRLGEALIKNGAVVPKELKL